MVVIDVQINKSLVLFVSLSCFDEKLEQVINSFGLRIEKIGMWGFFGNLYIGLNISVVRCNLWFV